MIVGSSRRAHPESAPKKKESAKDKEKQQKKDAKKREKQERKEARARQKEEENEGKTSGDEGAARGASTVGEKLTNLVYSYLSPLDVQEWDNLQHILGVIGKHSYDPTGDYHQRRAEEIAGARAHWKWEMDQGTLWDMPWGRTAPFSIDGIMSSRPSRVPVIY